MSDSQNSTTYESVQLPNSSHSTSLAKKTLVSRPDKNVSKHSKKTSNLQKKSTVSTKVKHKSSKSRNFQSDCMATINGIFKKSGFSKETRKLLTASWRSGTQKDYKIKFRKFCSWCHERKIDPYSASLTESAEFLTGLFTSGLQYRTIAGYRSMLSSVLPPIEKIPVGQHPFIIRLLKGVFNSRPPKVKLVPEWELPLVLDMLQKSPCKPLKKASLKFLTWKNSFLNCYNYFQEM